jgi:hypothetical protein
LNALLWPSLFLLIAFFFIWISIIARSFLIKIAGYDLSVKQESCHHSKIIFLSELPAERFRGIYILIMSELRFKSEVSSEIILLMLKRIFISQERI